MSTPNIFRTAPDSRIIEAGTPLFEQGDPADVMYAILDGEVEITIDGTVLEVVEAGGLVGEMALVSSGSPRSATARATVETMVVPVDEEEFLRHVHTTPFFALQVLRLTADRLRRTNELL